jgi:energy-coupling factor transporter ATP-binding protein EcfA2
MPLAPCVAVIGPPNSGKTTLLHLLDRALQRHPEGPLAYVVKGNPDGSGRYLFEAPGLREDLKKATKGAWCDMTVPTVAGWIGAARERLELVLLDLGGLRTKTNDVLFARCTHVIAIAREDASDELAAWLGDAARHGLPVVARVWSFAGHGAASAWRAADGVLECELLGESRPPDDTTNEDVIAAIVAELLALRVRRELPPYVDLHLRGRRWTVGDIADVAGRRERIEAEATSGGPVLLGGVAPVWAYAAALHAADDAHAHVRIEAFDPKQAAGWVAVPSVPAGASIDSLSARWVRRPDGASLLLTLTRADRFLPSGVAMHPERLPWPESPVPSGLLVTDGAVPTWVHLAYSRWLRNLAPGADLACWDGSLRGAVVVHGPRRGTLVDWPTASVP